MMGWVSTAFSIVSTVMGAVSAMNQASSQKKMAQYNAAVARNNALIADMQANDVIERGKLQRQEQERKTRALMGNQAATLAANGLQLSGSAANVLSDTELFGEIDANTISQNAKRQAWRYNVQASNDRAQAGGFDAQADSISPGMAGATTLLAGAGSVASKWMPSGSSSGLDLSFGSGKSGTGVDLANPYIGGAGVRGMAGDYFNPENTFDAYWKG